MSSEVILQLDAGNSAVKWRLVGTSPCQRGRIAVAELADMLEQLPEKPTKAVASCVAGSEIATQLSVVVKNWCGLTLEFASVVDGTGGLQCGYAEPEKLGVDRWLAMLAARRRYSEALIVVDAGSAATFDVVSAEGKHFGGYILPGLELMRTSLSGGTDQVHVERVGASNLALGCNTAAAVNSGALAALCALAEKLSCEHSARIVVAGGGGKLISEQLAGSEYCPDLVLDGLNVHFS